MTATALILQLLAQRPMTSTDVLDACEGYSKRYIRRLLCEMAGEGLIKRNPLYGKAYSLPKRS